MAKKKVNKAQLIKDAMAASPKASPAEIAKSLKKHGITAAYVSNVKSTASPKKKKKRGRPAAKKSTTSDKLSLGALVKAKKLADELGGVDKAKSLLDAVAKLR
jgi:hypothetical protein